MVVVRCLVAAMLAATLTLAMPQHGEHLTFEDKDVLPESLKSEVHAVKPLQESALARSRLRRQVWPRNTDDDDAHEGSAMEDLHPAVSTMRPSWLLGEESSLDELADCPADDLYTCMSGDVICGSQVCDGVADCPDWDDEDACGCDANETLCDGVLCVDNSRVCDGIRDCVDGTDEKNCDASNTTTTPGTATPNTAITTTTTPDTATPRTTITTTTPPRNTTPTTTPTTTTAVPTCRDGAPAKLCSDWKTYACFCDGVYECPHGEDERDCHHGVCRPGEWRCRCDGSCIPEQAVCNRHKDCPDGSDERGCVPGTGWWKCRCGGWITMRQRCDGRRDCRDGSDELSCPHKHHCHGSQHWLFSFNVRNRLQHLLNIFYDDDVSDESDEDDSFEFLDLFG